MRQKLAPNTPRAFHCQNIRQLSENLRADNLSRGSLVSKPLCRGATTCAWQRGSQRSSPCDARQQRSLRSSANDTGARAPLRTSDGSHSAHRTSLYLNNATPPLHPHVVPPSHHDRPSETLGVEGLLDLLGKPLHGLRGFLHGRTFPPELQHLSYAWHARPHHAAQPHPARRANPPWEQKKHVEVSIYAALRRESEGRVRADRQSTWLARVLTICSVSGAGIDAGGVTGSRCEMPNVCVCALAVREK